MLNYNLNLQRSFAKKVSITHISNSCIKHFLKLLIVSLLSKGFNMLPITSIKLVIKLNIMDKIPKNRKAKLLIKLNIFSMIHRNLEAIS